MKKWVYVVAMAAASTASAPAEEPGNRAACYQTRWRAADTEVRPVPPKIAGLPEIPLPPVRAAALCGPLPAVLPVTAIPLSEPSPVRQASYAAPAPAAMKGDPVRLPTTLLAPESVPAVPKAWLQKPVVRPAGSVEMAAGRGPIRAISQD